MGGLAGGKDGGAVGGKQGGDTVGGKEGSKDGGKNGGGSTVALQLDRQTAEALLVALTSALGSGGGGKSTKSPK